MKADLTKTPTKFRATPARGLKTAANEPAVDRDGGDYGYGIIRGLAVVTRGEALGHGIWLDQTFVSQVAEAMSASKSGVKARFTHPGLSSDGMGKFLGRVKGGRLDGDVARGDLHLTETAHNTPDGDLADYVMQLAEEDPEAFGTSIVFERDLGSEDRLRAENTDEDGLFKSPDSDNKQNYRHARLAKLWGDDIVDEPAANPGGLFHRGDEIAAEADGLLSYALGLNSERPELAQLEIDPDRVSGFVTRFLSQHGLKVVRTQEVPPMSEPIKPGAPDPENKPADVDLARERLSALKSKYEDPAFILEMFEGGKSMAEAETEWLRRQNAKLAEKLQAAEAENRKLSSEKPKPGAEPVAFSGAPEDADGSFEACARKYQEEHKCTYREACSAVARKSKGLYKDHKRGLGCWVSD